MKQTEFTDLPRISTYRFENFFNIYQDSNDLFKYYNIIRGINLFPANNTEAEDSYTVKYSDSWVSISYQYYNTIDLWWLVCAYNQIENPTSMPEPGTILKLLKSSYVSKVLSELKKQVSR
jgi:hypothetical protein